MTFYARTTRVKRGLAAVTLATLVATGIAAPLTATAAMAAEVQLPTEPLIDTGTEWNYLDDNTEPVDLATNHRDAWTAPDFDDSEWKTAPTGFGVLRGVKSDIGDHPAASGLNYWQNGESGDTIPTYFFRTTFELDEAVAEAAGGATTIAVHDDALRLWVNGERVAGVVDSRVDDSLPTNLQYAGESRGAPLVSEIEVPGELLRAGENTVAVALFQDRASSSDAYFDLRDFVLTEGPEKVDGVIVADPTRVILTPTETPATSQSFTWRVGHESHTQGQVEIGLAGAEETFVVDATQAQLAVGQSMPHYSATVDGLLPATEYRYRVGVPESMSEWFTFKTADPSATDFQFVYYGDAQIGLDSTWPNVVEQAEANATRSIGSVHAGDLIDTSSNDTQWMNWFKGMERSAASKNVFAAPGNHEYSGDKLMTAWKANFEYPLNQPSTESIGELAALAQGDSDSARQHAAYFAHWAEFAAETVYYADYQNVRFITLNATRDSTFLKPDGEIPSCSGDDCIGSVSNLWVQYQAAWLDYILKNSPSKWNVVTFHQPVYSTSSGRNEPVLREHWVPVFEENNIDLVLMGHDHTYARGYNTDDLTETDGVTTGPVYAVSNSGAKHYNLETEERNVWTNNGAHQLIRGQYVTTYQVIDVSQDQLVYRSYVAEKTGNAASWVMNSEQTKASEDGRPVYEPKNVPAIGQVFDEFTVTKYSTGQKFVTEVGVEVPAGPQVAAGVDGEEITEIEAGESVTFSGTGFVPETELSLELHSTPVVLDTAVVGADGSFSATVTIPADTSTDVAHSLVAVLPNGNSVSMALTVLPAAVDDETPGETEDETPGETEDETGTPGDENETPGDETGIPGDETGIDGDVTGGSEDDSVTGDDTATGDDSDSTVGSDDLEDQNDSPVLSDSDDSDSNNSGSNNLETSNAKGGNLSNTGGEVMPWVVIALVLMAAGGAILVVRNRKLTE